MPTVLNIISEGEKLARPVFVTHLNNFITNNCKNGTKSHKVSYIMVLHKKFKEQVVWITFPNIHYSYKKKIT